MKFHLGQVAFNNRWRRYGVLVKRTAKTFREGQMFLVYTGYRHEGTEFWVERDMRKLRVRERKP